jgi:segregation and condensation protein B
MQLLKQHIEALIFVAEQNITIEEIQNSLKTAYGWELTKKEVLDVLDELKQQYNNEEYSFELIEIADGFQFLTKKEYHTAVNTLLQIKAKKRLSTAALETLAIIAYKQPISKSEMEHIRGVSCDYSIQKLLEKELIVIEGKSDGPGKPLLYGTSKNFMDHFGLKTVKDLPKLKDLHIAENEIGVPADLMDSLISDEKEADMNDLVKAAEIMDTPLSDELEQHLQSGDAIQNDMEETE